METKDLGPPDTAGSFLVRLEPFHARALVTACIFFETHTASSKKSKETPLIAGVEYLALLLADRIASDVGRVPTYDEAAEIALGYRAVFDAAYQAIQSPDPLVSDLAYGRMALSGLTIRNPAVPQHWSAILDSIALTADRYFSDGLHFSLTEALSVQASIVNLTLSKSDAWLRDLNERASRLSRALKARRTPPMSDDDEAVIELARSHPLGSQKKKLQAILIDRALGDRPTGAVYRCVK